MEHSDSEKETPSNEEKDDQNARLSQSYDSSINQSDKRRLLNEDNSSENKSLSALPNDLSDFIESPRSRLARFVPDSPYKINDNLKNDSKVCIRPPNLHQSYHISYSMEEEDEDSDCNDHTYSKSCDYSEEIIENLHQHFPITRSVSEDFLHRPSAAYERRISVVSSSKGRLAGVPRVYPKEKHTRTPSLGAPHPPHLPSRISQDEEELLQKSSFTRQKKYVALCLCLVDFTAFLSMSIIAPFFPREASQKGMREAVSGFVFSIYALIVMLASPIFGKMLPCIGAKFMFLSGVAFCGTCNVLFGLLDRVNGQVEFTVLCFVVRSFEALGAAAFCTASCTILIDQFPDHIGAVFGFIETCMGVGMSLGPAIGGALYAAGGFGLPFFILGGFVVSIVPVCWFLLRDTEDPKNVIHTTNTVSYMKLLSMPHVLVLCLILAVSSQAQAFVDPTLEPHMRQYNLDSSIIGVLFLLLSGAYGLASPIVGWVSGKVENKYPIMIVGLLLVTASLLLLGPSEYLPIEGSVWLSVVALALLGFSLAAAYIPTFESIFIAAMNGGLADDINTYSVVSGLWNSVYSLGEVTGPSLGGVLSDFLAFPKAATLMAFCTLSAFFVAILAWYNPYHCFGKYNLIEDAPEKMTLSQNAQVNSHIPSREVTPLQNGCVHTYGSLCDDKKDPIV